MTLALAAIGAGFGALTWVAMIASGSGIAASEGATLTIGAGAPRSFAGMVHVGAPGR